MCAAAIHSIWMEIIYLSSSCDLKLLFKISRTGYTTTNLPSEYLHSSKSIFMALITVVSPPLLSCRRAVAVQHCLLTTSGEISINTKGFLKKVGPWPAPQRGDASWCSKDPMFGMYIVHIEQKKSLTKHVKLFRPRFSMTLDLIGLSRCLEVAWYRNVLWLNKHWN